MKFSIIICTYNVDSSVSKTLESVLTQDFLDYEVVIVDGGSTDNTINLIKKFENKFGGKLRWVSESDKGIYDAMNKGIDMSRGNWLYFLGSGDLFNSEKVLNLISKKIDDLNCDVIYGNVRLGNTNRIYGEKFTSRKLIEKNISHQAIFFSKKIFKILGCFNIKYEILADWEFNIRWFNDRRIKSKYVDIIIADYELGGRSSFIFDKEFYQDLENNVKKYCSNEIFYFFKKEKKFELIFAKNQILWNIWLWKNKVKFVLLNPKDFLNKYFFKK